MTSERVDTIPASREDTLTSSALPTDDVQSIRDTLSRPPGDYSPDWVDVVEFPLKVVGWPLDMLLVRLPAWMAANVTAPRPPNFITRGYRNAVEWGFVPAIQTNIGPRSGVAYEQQFTRFHPLYVHAAVSQRFSQRHRIGVGLDGEHVRFGTELKWQRDAERPFHGIGSQTERDARAFFKRDAWDLSASVGAAISSFLSISAGAGYEHNTIGDPIADTESIFATFPVDALFGAETQTQYARIELSGTLDFAPWENFQQKGFQLGIGGRQFVGIVDTESDFRQLDGFFHTYVPLNAQQVFAFRVVSQIIRDVRGDGVPFFHLSSLGGSRSALGFPTNRFVANDMVSFMSEYRFEVWRELYNQLRAETFLFFHYGAVGERLGSIESGDWHPSYGLGLRLSQQTMLLALGYLGFSSEGVTAGVRTSWRF
jgi:hypothetical protein